MVTIETLRASAQKLAPQMTAWRRELHRYPEAAWTEYRTTAYLANELARMGYELLVGGERLSADDRLGLPDDAALAAHELRAAKAGVEAALLHRMRGGRTGLCAVLRTKKPGRTVCLRFDIDANDLTESADESHRPAREGFVSRHRGVMHACGHDGHMAVGLAAAALLMQAKDDLSGTVKLLFQPAEEGVRGAKAVAAGSLLADVDLLLGFHLGFRLNKSGQLACGCGGFLATTKFNAAFEGQPAHAGAAPEEGRNALLAAATAAVQLHALPRTGRGASRINVGTLRAGESRNTIAAHAQLAAEVRGETNEINALMMTNAMRVVKSSADLHDTAVTIDVVGEAACADSSPVLAERIGETAKRLRMFTDIRPTIDFGASEDFSLLMNRVQAQGGEAAYFLLGTQLASGHHTDRFDFDESVLPSGAALLTAVVLGL